MHHQKSLANGVVASLLVAGSAVALPSSSYSSAFQPANAHCKATSQWPGWAGIKYNFIFCDSYTQTGFNYSLAPAPSASNPLGNPAYHGYTSSNGPNWVDYLTVEYNASIVQTYNLAYGGATVDSDLVTPWKPTVLSVKDQVLDEFVPGYSTLDGNTPSAVDPPAWHGRNTLFAIWIGINDIGNSYAQGAANTTLLNAKIIAEYASLVDVLYRAGGRNFVFLTVPPVNRSPLTLAYDADVQAEEKADIAQYNGLVASMAAQLKAKHTRDANVWVFDPAVHFNRVLDNPAAYPQTANIKNTTSYCVDYQNGTDDDDTLIASCGIPVNEYFWLNSLHPTYPIHNVVAQQLAKTLEAGPNICRK